MNRLLTIVFALLLFTSCRDRLKVKVTVTDGRNKADSIKMDSMNRLATTLKPANAELPESVADVEPTFDEVKTELLSRYNKVERIDTTVVVGNDSLHVHEKYYCLKDNAVILPKRYLWGGDTTKDFVTHSWVTHIIIIKNKDTIINKIFRKKDFDPVVNPEERKYAIIFTADFSGYKKNYNALIFCYSITIPLTDVGVPACIAIDLNGRYKMLDEYANLDEN